LRGVIGVKNRTDLPDSSESSLLRVAFACLEGLKIFTIGTNFHSGTIIPVAILEGHCLEVAMKCHLMQCGQTNDDIKKLGHSLSEIWTEAAKLGEPFALEVPSWLSSLHWGHSAPYPFRYLPHNFGAGCPDPAQVVEFMSPILQTLRKRCGILV
jgi:hypothetical protein